MNAIEDFAYIASRLRELQNEKPKDPIVHDPNPPEYVEPQDNDLAWGWYDLPC